MNDLEIKAKNLQNEIEMIKSIFSRYIAFVEKNEGIDTLSAAYLKTSDFTQPEIEFLKTFNECPECLGEGKIRIGNYPSKYKPCEKCNGSGKIQ